MTPQVVTVSSAASSAPIPVDWRANPFSMSLGCDVSSGGTLTYKVQYTFDDIYASGWDPSTAAWQDHPVLVALSASSASNLAFPVRAIRLTVTAYTNGSVRLTALQSNTNC